MLLAIRTTAIIVTFALTITAYGVAALLGDAATLLAADYPARSTVLADGFGWDGYRP